jgi:hypothetical protein
MKNNNIFRPLLFIFLFFINSCSKPDPVTGKTEVIEPNPYKRAQQIADKGGGIFGDINRVGKSPGNFEFSTSNVLWRATLKNLEFLPLLNADYAGGIIIYDWYSQSNNPNEQIKISVQFLSNELRSDSVKIIAHKKICDSFNKCSNTSSDQKFAETIKDSIIASARTLKIEEAKKEKK